MGRQQGQLQLHLALALALALALLSPAFWLEVVAVALQGLLGLLLTALLTTAFCAAWTRQCTFPSCPLSLLRDQYRAVTELFLVSFFYAAV